MSATHSGDGAPFASRFLMDGGKLRNDRDADLGTQVVLYQEFEARFKVLNFKERSTKNVDAAKGVHLRTMTRAADGKGFFASNAKQLGAQLMHIDLHGKAHVLWELNGNNVFLSGKPSPDGRHLAIQTSAGSSNMWMIENF